MIKKINIEGLEQLIKEYKTKSGGMENFVFWIGAGMDCISPTNLPLGNELVKQILNFTCNNYADRILEVLNDATVAINQFIASDHATENMSTATNHTQNNQFTNIPRLETIIELILQCEHNMIPPIKSEDSFMSLITSFRAAPPNINHYILADAILKGATIITVNYTLLIQEAFQQITNGAHVLEEQQDYSKTDSEDDTKTNLVRLFQCKRKDGHGNIGGKLYHIHGALIDENLGNSLSKVKNPFINQFNDDLTKLLEGENIFLFLGYSGSDSFDVNRFFIDYAKKYGTKKSTGIYVSHEEIDTKSNGEILVCDKQRILLNAFKRKYILQAELKNIFCDIGHTPRNYEDFIWKDEIPKTGYPKEMQKILAIDICAFLGINIEKVINIKDWLPNDEEKKYYTDWYQHHPCLLMAKLQQNKKLVNFHSKYVIDYEKRSSVILNLTEEQRNNQINIYKKQLYSEHLDLLIRDALNQLTDSVFNLDFNKIFDIIKDARQEGTLFGWEVSTRLHQIVKRLMYKYLECSSDDEFSTFSVQYNSLAKSVISALKFVEETGYKYVSGMNQFHLSLRDLSILYALFKDDKDADQSVEEILNLSSYYYCEVSSMDGWIGNLLSKIFIITHELRQKKELALLDKILCLENEFIKINSILGSESDAFFAKKISSFRNKLNLNIL